MSWAADSPARGLVSTYDGSASSSTSSSASALAQLSTPRTSSTPRRRAGRTRCRKPRNAAGASPGSRPVSRRTCSYPCILSGCSGVAAAQPPGRQTGQDDRVPAQDRESGPRAQLLPAEQLPGPLHGPAGVRRQVGCEPLDAVRAGTILEPSEPDYARAVQRGLGKRAPFTSDKNSVADALLIENLRFPDLRDRRFGCLCVRHLQLQVISRCRTGIAASRTRPGRAVRLEPDHATPTR